MSRHSVLYPESDFADVPEFLGCLQVLVDRDMEWLSCANQSYKPAVVAAYCGSSFDGEGLHISAYEKDSKPHTVVFAPTATKWGNEKGLKAVTDDQINLAFRLFLPLARSAAKASGQKIHVRYAKRHRYTPSQNMQKLLDSFCLAINRECLHPLDWERFYRLIRHCHSHGVQMGAGDFFRELRARNVPKGLAAELAELYEFGRSLLCSRFNWQDRER